MSDSALQPIYNLVGNYGTLLDRLLVDRWLDLFAEPSVLDIAGAVLRTRRERENLATSAPRGLHLGNLPVIAGNPEVGVVRATSSFMFWNIGKCTALTGWYDDEIRSDGDEWQFVSRRISYLDGAALSSSIRD
jgi:hypothetical protein